MLASCTFEGQLHARRLQTCWQRNCSSVSGRRCYFCLSPGHTSIGRGRRGTRHTQLTRSTHPSEEEQAPTPTAATSSLREKTIWVQTTTQGVLTAAVEAGLQTFVFPSQLGQAEAWQALARFNSVFICGDDLKDSDGTQIGVFAKISSKDDLQSAARLADQEGFVLMDFTDWQVIPAENLVAAFDGKRAMLLAAANTAADAQLFLEALEIGTDGVVLCTEDAAEVRHLAKYAKDLALSSQRLQYEVGQVRQVRNVGMGDRAAVDLCSLMVPGEGLLLGSFARALFLVHSECSESQYINSRPFRVNAGPVHSYLQAPGGRTAYLSELQSGSKVVIVDAEGRQRAAVVGRVKIESRPLVLVEAETPDGQRHSVILQNAETVKLVTCQQQPSSAAPAWTATSVSELKSGDQIYVYRQEAARHTGISIQERILER